VPQSARSAWRRHRFKKYGVASRGERHLRSINSTTTPRRFRLVGTRGNFVVLSFTICVLLCYYFSVHLAWPRHA